MPKILFVLKRRDGFDPIVHTDPSLQCGLYNSISYVNDMLISMDIESQIKICVDNNCINGHVYNFKPTHVIIEALWVIPDKIKLLQSMYPKIIWIIRLHSAMPFLGIESSVSMKWIAEYSLLTNVFISVNDLRLKTELEFYLSTITTKEILFLPNYYPQDFKPFNKDFDKDTIDISCFGAIRPFKNLLTQALASIEFCKRLNKKLRFHINEGRIEVNGNNVYTNLVHLFSKLDENFELILHPWANRENFLNICLKEVDIGLQVSFTETFNLVTADLLSQGVPVIGSSEIPWMNEKYFCNPTDATDIIRVLNIVYKNPILNIEENNLSLIEYTEKTKKVWSETIL
jgi:hypothetical protein